MLAVGQGSITVPGCLAATPIEAPITVEEGYPTSAPLVYYFGHTSPDKQDELYRVSSRMVVDSMLGLIAWLD